MVESLDIQGDDEITEVGAGTGVVTQPLALTCQSKQAHLTAVEFDIDLIPILKSKIPENENVKIVNANILNFLDDYKIPQNAHLKVIGSLPYNITSPLLHRLIKTDPMPEACVFLIQKEVAQKICAQAPDSNYLSVFVQTFYEGSILKLVDKNLFSPVPKVDGAVIKLVRKPSVILPKAGLSSRDISRYEKFLHHVFSHPRKMLNKVFTKEELEKYQLDGGKRPQNYNNETYTLVYNTAIQ